MLFDKRELREMVYNNSERLEKVEEWVTSTSRWSIHYDVVFKDLETNKHYLSYYSVGATEYQDEEPYEFESDEVKCKEVVLKEVVVSKWIEV